MRFVTWLKTGLLAVMLLGSRAVTADEPRLHVVCSTYPMWLLTRAVVADVESVRVDLLVPAETGCPHDYVLTPAAMRRLMRADAVILNGLGLDDFMHQAMVSAQTDAHRIDTSAGIDDLLPSRVPLLGKHPESRPDPAPHNHGHPHGHDHVQGHNHHHDHASRKHRNPHLFASPRQAARIVENIAEGLSAVDAGHAASYRAAAHAAAERLRRLSETMTARAKTFERRTIVTQHDIFDYLARDLALSVVAVIQEGEAVEPTASALRHAIRNLREHEVAALIAEPQYRDHAMRVLSAETGVPLVTLDPLASGPSDAGLDYYEAVMRSNIETLERWLR